MKEQTGKNMQGIQIIGMGKALPSRLVKNEELENYVDTSDSWIRSRTGIETRYFSKGETAVSLAVRAGEKALEAAGISPEQIGLCLISTITPDYATPSDAALVQRSLHLPGDIPAFDINAACSGFVYGLNVASCMLGSDTLPRPYALLIGVEQLSRILNMKDRSTCVLFGDGAAAAVIRRSGEHRFFSRLASSGDAQALNSPGAARKEPYIHMDGKKIFRFAVKAIEEGIDRMESESGISAEEVDYIVCHQANKRIIDHVRKKRKLPEEKFFMNLMHYGNTSGASIPLALADMYEAGMLTAGKRLFCIGFGGGLTKACAYLEM